MATLQNVQHSQGTLKDKKDDIIIGGSLNIETQVPEQKFVLFKLCQKKRGRTHIDGIADGAINPKTKRPERIWLINGADSIWQSELLDLLKDREYVNRNRRSLIFEDGICRISTDDVLALEFARANKKNVGKQRNIKGKFFFYEYDANEEAKDRMAKQMLKINTVVKVSELKAEPMKKLASFLGITFVDEIGMPKNEESIRSELMLKADSNPETVNRYMDSEEVEISWLVKKAIIDTKIDINGNPGNAVWVNGGGFIAKIPAGRKHFEYLTEFAMTKSDDGRKFLEQLKHIVT